MRKIHFTGPGKTYQQLAKEFGIPPRGVVLELNPVLGRLRAALRPRRSAAVDGALSAVVFLEGFHREGKGAQAYFAARDWLRLTQIGIGLTTGVVLVDCEEDLRGLAETRHAERLLILVRRAEHLPLAAERAALLRRILVTQESCAMLILSEAGLTGSSVRSLAPLYQELAADAAAAASWTAAWLEMEGMSEERLKHHVQGRCRLAGLDLGETAWDELIDLVRIEADNAPAEAPRVLLGLLHRALDQAARQPQELDPRPILVTAVREYMDAQIEELAGDWRVRLRTLWGIFSYLADASPWLRNKVPIYLLDLLLARYAGTSLAQIRDLYPSFLKWTDENVTFRVPGALEPSRKGGPEFDPERIENELIEDVRSGTLSAEAVVPYFIGRGRLDRLTLWLPSASAESARWLGEAWSAVGWEEDPELLAAAPRETRAGYLLGKLENGFSVRDLLFARDPQAWGQILGAVARLEATDALAGELSALFGGEPSEDWWLTMLEEACKGGPLSSAAAALWLDGYQRSLAPAALGTGVAEGEARYEGAEGPAGTSAALGHLALINRLMLALEVRGLGAVLDILIQELLPQLPVADLVDALTRSCLLPMAGWPKLRESVCRHLPLWTRLHLFHVLMISEESRILRYPAWLVSELEASTAEAGTSWLWAIAEVLGHLADLDFPPLHEARGWLDRLQAALRAHDPVESFLGEKVLLARGAEEIALLFQELRPVLAALPAVAQFAAAAQALMAALLAASGRSDESQGEFEIADRLFNLLGMETGVGEMFSRLLRARQRESTRRRSYEREPGGRTGSLLAQGTALLRQNRDLEGVRCLTEALRSQPGCLATILILASAYERLGKQEQVGELLAQALDLVGEHYEVGRALVRHYEATGGIEDALAWCQRLCEMVRWEPEFYRDYVATATSLAFRAGRMEEVLAYGLIYTQRFGYNHTVFCDLIVAFREVPLPAIPSPVPLVRALLARLPPTDRLDRISLLVRLGDGETVRAQLFQLLREGMVARSGNTLHLLARQFPEGPDQLFLELLGHLRFDSLIAADAALEELAQTVPGRSDLDVFRAAIHLDFANKYAQRGMVVHTERHLDIAFRAYIQALWNGYAGAEMTRLAAEIFCLKLITNQDSISSGDAEAARELLNASQFEQANLWSLYELEIRLEIRVLRSQVLATGIDSLHDILQRHEEALRHQIGRLLDEAPSAAMAFRNQYHLIHEIVTLVEGTVSELRPDLQNLLGGLEPRFLIGNPDEFETTLLRGEALLRIAEGLGMSGAVPARVLAALHRVKELLELASELQPSPEGSELKRATEASAERVRLGIKLQRTEALILEYELRH